MYVNSAAGRIWSCSPKQLYDDAECRRRDVGGKRHNTDNPIVKTLILVRCTTYSKNRLEASGEMCFGRDVTPDRPDGFG
jgi:hypothetical protein